MRLPTKKQFQVSVAKFLSDQKSNLKTEMHAHIYIYTPIYAYIKMCACAYVGV